MRLTTHNTLVHVSGECTIEKAKEIRNILIDLVDMMPKMEIDLSEVTEVDYCFIQILHYLHILMIKKGKHLQILKISKSIKDEIIKTGFCSKGTCDLIDRKCQIHDLVHTNDAV